MMMGPTDLVMSLWQTPGKERVAKDGGMMLQMFWNVVSVVLAPVMCKEQTMGFI